MHYVTGRPKQRGGMKNQSAITQTALYTRYCDQKSYLSGGEAAAPRPPLAFDDDGADATAERLRHIDAGRIKVR